MSNINKILKELEILNNDTSHFESRDDICTPIPCVKKMIDYIPKNLWLNKDIKVLDLCAGNGNFFLGVIYQQKTELSNIRLNEINDKRLNNCKTILNPQNISKLNALDITPERFGLFDLVIATPPILK